MIRVIVGPPCAGKSTHVRNNAKTGDLIIDYDVIAQAFGSANSHDSSGLIRSAALQARSAAIDTALESEADSWVIHTNPKTDLIDRYSEAGAEFTTIDPTQAECLARAETDERPAFTVDVINNWYENKPVLPEPRGQIMNTKEFLTS